MTKNGNSIRPTKVRITMWIDPRTIEQFKEVAKRREMPYQRLMQEALKHAIVGYLPKWEKALKDLWSQ